MKFHQVSMQFISHHGSNKSPNSTIASNAVVTLRLGFVEKEDLKFKKENWVITQLFVFKGKVRMTKMEKWEKI